MNFHDQFLWQILESNLEEKLTKAEFFSQAVGFVWSSVNDVFYDTNSLKHIVPMQYRGRLQRICNWFCLPI